MGQRKEYPARKQQQQVNNTSNVVVVDVCYCCNKNKQMYTQLQNQLHLLHKKVPLCTFTRLRLSYSCEKDQ